MIMIKRNLLIQMIINSLLLIADSEDQEGIRTCHGVSNVPSQGKTSSVAGGFTPAKGKADAMLPEKLAWVARWLIDG